MKVAGQTQVVYVYDAANRLTTMNQCKWGATPPHRRERQHGGARMSAVVCARAAPGDIRQRPKVCTSSYGPPQMTTTLSVRIDTDTKRRLEALAKRVRRSKSFLAAEAIVAFVEAESWQLDEIQTGIKELDDGGGVPHKDVATWLGSWGRKRERRAPHG
jgi:RHH-type transcriptional regulator, rel operon repressor / antitoxin RelB